MRVIRAEAMGMCFGVRDALQVLADLDGVADVTIHGELVHNEQVIRTLRLRGFRMQEERDRDALPASPRVVVTAHGISDRRRAGLLAAGKVLVDTTCPLVRRVHEAAQELRREGRFVVVAGKRDHVEVQGIVEDLEDFAVVARPEEAAAYPATALGLVSQSTMPPRLVEAIRAAVAAANPGTPLRAIDTVCRPTRERQLAAETLLDQVQAVVVVGGRQSNNTRELVRLAERRGVPAVHVQSAAELDPAWFAPFEVVGLTAGTSTLPETIDAVYAVLQAL